MSNKKLEKIKSISTLSKAGTLNRGRRGHNVIFDGEKFLVVGGWAKKWLESSSPYANIEVCTLSGSTMTCVEKQTSLANYALYPALFLVPDDFGKDKTIC